MNCDTAQRIEGGAGHRDIDVEDLRIGDVRAGHLQLASERIGDVDFIARAGMLERACAVLEEMVGLLRKGMALETTKELNDKLQAIEAEADRLILELYRDTYTNETDPMRYLILKDLFEILEKAIDRCRDAGNVIYGVVLKNA